MRKLRHQCSFHRICESPSELHCTLLRAAMLARHAQVVHPEQSRFQSPEIKNGGVGRRRGIVGVSVSRRLIYSYASRLATDDLRSSLDGSRAPLRTGPRQVSESKGTRPPMMLSANQIL